MTLVITFTGSLNVSGQCNPSCPDFCFENNTNCDFNLEWQTPCGLVPFTIPAGTNKCISSCIAVYDCGEHCAGGYFYNGDWFEITPNYYEKNYSAPVCGCALGYKIIWNGSKFIFECIH